MAKFFHSFRIKLIFRSNFVFIFLLINGCKINKKTTDKQPINFLHESNLKNNKNHFTEKQHQSFNTIIDTFGITDFNVKHYHFRQEFRTVNPETIKKIDSTVVLNPKVDLKNIDGKVRDLRILFAYLGISLFILALLFLIFAIIKWYLIYLLGTAFSSAASYLLLKLGKKKLKGQHIFLDKKSIKEIKKWALRLFIISLLTYLILGLFH
jgi:hypothetical protein